METDIGHCQAILPAYNLVICIVLGTLCKQQPHQSRSRRQKRFSTVLMRRPLHHIATPATQFQVLKIVCIDLISECLFRDNMVCLQLKSGTAIHTISRPLVQPLHHMLHRLPRRIMLLKTRLAGHLRAHLRRIQSRQHRLRHLLVRDQRTFFQKHQQVVPFFLRPLLVVLRKLCNINHQETIYLCVAQNRYKKCPSNGRYPKPNKGKMPIRRIFLFPAKLSQCARYSKTEYIFKMLTFATKYINNGF